MRTPFIAGNWKMNFSAAEAVDFVNQIKTDLDKIEGVDKAVCPPFVAIPGVSEALRGTSIGVGAQNMHYETSGAYTGEIAPAMLAPFCQYVILGHSERREYFHESDELVNKKVHAALKNGLTPIVCVGESLEQNESGKTQAIVSSQVKAAFADVKAKQAVGCVIAYEPIWAIGTGKSASVEQAGGIIKSSVRDTLAELFGEETAEAIRIQYGGSVKEHNIADYMSHPDIDGALVGGASLKPGFVELVRNSI